MAATRILPINWNTGANAKIREEEVVDKPKPPKAAIQSITLAIRVGQTKQYALGYIQAFNWSMTREAQPIHQIEPYPDGTFGGGSFETASFGSSYYWPGEPVEVIPGKVGGIDITLNKYAMYTLNLLRATLAADGAGTEHTLAQIPTLNADLHYNEAGQNEYVSLIQQVRPIYIYQSYINPLSGANAFGRVFEECWFTSLGEEIPEASQNGPIMESGRLTATRIRPYTTPDTAKEA